MTLRRTLLLAAIFSAAPTAMVMAQNYPQNDQTTSPSSASSPHQREATSTNTPEASTTDQTNSSNPSAASSPHQRQATHTASSKQAMKDCIAQKQSENSGMSTADAKKACKAQMKGPG